MARFRQKEPRKEESSSFVTDDFIWNDPEAHEENTVSDLSDTPDEALRKFRKKSAAETQESAGSRDNTPEPDSDARVAGPDDFDAFKNKVYSSGVMLDDDLQPIPTEKKRKKHGIPRLLRGIILGLVTAVLLICVAAFIFHRISPSTPGLDAPENAISGVLSPVQSLFSSVTDAFVNYFRGIKLKANIEAEYEAVRAENEQLVYKAMLADELQNTLRQYEDMSDEIVANADMKPIVCTVIGRSDGNYFLTFTINKGLNDGIEDYMAVTIGGALVGYTENVQASKATVRSIIDKEASIAALIQSSRDQGTVRGTLSVDTSGSPLCRMYYLPDDNLPRPGDTVVTSGVGMSFPKGIPIGTVRESTRGMEDNKQYIIIEPLADFRHVEYVIVLRYKPYAEAIEGRDNGQSLAFVPLESARPSPVVPEIASSLFESQNTPDPNETPTPTPEPTPTPTPSPTPMPTPTPSPEATNLTYNQVSFRSDPTPSPTPSPEPTPTPYITPDPESMTFEED